ncbi:GntR family transcriptional regulator [Frigidibacter sp. ROC022]|uniref:GntR family transcriptional regulator n=1 Tax=Frigidibacter sp. ROC022 TaxID=2971796 RepID=UPI00215B54F5|nr:GntR family transcriptional regulator [Frigidibacter sp. ROC022]MCR8725725.1 GntR family transcriptional regulator [Frigidibacter sp. ROC022]
MQRPLPDAPNADSPRRRFDLMYREIQRRICVLDYRPGQKLSEEALAREFGVSRTPLRRVLGRLEEEGLVQSVHGVGTMVTDPDIEELSQVFRLRLELAEIAGRFDPRPPTPEEMAGFERLLARSRDLAAAPEARAFSVLNMDFFRAHLALVGNDPLREISDRLYCQTARIWLKSVSASRIDLKEEVDYFCREIADMVDALRNGDAEAAALIHRTHILMSFGRMRRNSDRG